MVCARSGPIRIESAEFSRCRDHSAVVVHRLPGRRALSFTVHFRDVRFYRNGDAHALVYGGAVRTSQCPAGACLRLRFTSCLSSENRATYGGALYAEDADLDMTNSTSLKMRLTCQGVPSASLGILEHH